VKAAIVMKKAGVTLPQALRKLKAAHESIRVALDEDLEPTLRRLLAVSET
jgi:N-acetylmuramic acid 6-phosphate (MurNAc-6-P) etherase